MEASIVKIGNSKGLIIPKKMLDSLGDNKRFDIQLKNGSLIITPLEEIKPRQNWENQFALAFKEGYSADEKAIDVENEFDKEDWTW